MTKLEAFNQKYPNFDGEVDFALPESWVDWVVAHSKLTYDQIICQFCWAYDKDCFGHPLPLTEEADEIMRTHHILFR